MKHRFETEAQGNCLLIPGQTIATWQHNISQHCWAQHVVCVGHHVAMCCDVLAVVGSSLTIFKLEPTTPNTSQHGGQTHTTCCAQQCCDMLCWRVAIVWPGLKGQTLNDLLLVKMRVLQCAQ